MDQLFWRDAPPLEEAPPLDPVQRRIVAECDRIKEMLLAKNRRYGNSALAPKRIFSNASTVEQLLVRIDDKLSRIRTTGFSAMQEDGERPTDDLIGYLVLLNIAVAGETTVNEKS